MINGNDGGLNISRDGGEDWEFISNLPLGQFYHINYDMDIPYNIYGGMQDNGSWKAPGYVWHANGIRNEDWQEISFGDGFDVVPVPGNPDEAYAMYQGGNVYKIHIPTGKMNYIQPLHPEGIPLRFNWNAAIAQNPFSGSSVYFGSQLVHKSENMGQTWRVISPDLTTNDTTKQKQALSGGLTIDATRAENYTTITTIAPSQHNQNVIWAGTDDGNIQLTKNGGETWTNLSPKIRSLRKGSWIAQIVVGAKEGEAVVVVNDYRRNHWKPYVLHTYDFGKTWENLVADVPDMAHCHAVVQDSKEPNLLFVGTERGLYFSLDKGVNWQKWTNNYPSVPTIDLKIHPRESDLIIGTFGRAAYILDDIEPLRQMAKDGPALLNQDMVMFDTHPAYQAEWRRAAGSRFQADHVWQGDNKRPGAMMSMFFSAEILDEEEKAKVEVMDDAGNLIRNWTFEPDTGIFRFRWNLRANGVRMPQLSKPDEDSDPPGGMLVLPGTYKVKVSYKELEVSQDVQVLHDPRLDFDTELHAAKREKMDALEESIAIASQKLLDLQEIKDAIALAKKNAEYKDDSSSVKFEENWNKSLEAIKEFELLYMNSPDFKGYDHVTVRLNGMLWDAMSHIESMDDTNAENANLALKRATDEVDRVQGIVEAFVSGTWEPLRQALIEAELLPKKD
ncbi:MAG: hypothetical protein AAF193_02860, partial [Bacteroidota bacterium]